MSGDKMFPCAVVGVRDYYRMLYLVDSSGEYTMCSPNGDLIRGKRVANPNLKFIRMEDVVKAINLYLKENPDAALQGV